MKWGPGVAFLSLALQVVAYLVYETGVSIETNIRIDLLLIIPMIAYNAWIVLGGSRDSNDMGPAV